MISQSGGGFVRSYHHNHSPQPTTQTVIKPDYNGPTYAVTYLGVVDGTMGVLSRTMPSITQRATRSSP